MFSGIIETTARVQEAQSAPGLVQVKLEKPSDFNDLSVGDSVACNGVCLTVESYEGSTIQFSLAAETLQVTGWNAQNLLGRRLNLERSLRLGDRIHGHLVSGHVDEMGQVESVDDDGGSRWIWVQFSKNLMPMIWPKGSVAINGVSLTINQVLDGKFSVCLIPETLNRTNLKDLKPGDAVTLEADNLARGYIHNIEERHKS